MQLADAPDDLGEDGRATIPAFIPVDAGDDGMLQFHGFDSLGDPVGLHPIQELGTAVLDIAKST